MRILFAGNPDIAVPTLESLHNSSHEVVGVLTNPVTKAGRGLKMNSTPIAQAAFRLWGNSVPVLTLDRKSVV